MNVLFVAAEVAPLIKTGGLADVAGALPAALRALGHDVRVVMPYYKQLRDRGIAVDGPLAATFLPIGDRAEELRVWQSRDGAVPTYLLDIPAAFERSSIYGDGDDNRRFTLFARGVLALMQQLREVNGWQPDVVHAHDWHAALVANYLQTQYAYTFGGAAPLRRVRPGTALRLWSDDAFGGKLRAVTDLSSEKVDLSFVNPQTGPFHVEGAEPGDTLAIHLVSLEPARDWGASAHIPFFGGMTGTDRVVTLQDALSETTYIYQLDRASGTVRFDARFGDLQIDLPLEPMLGTVGVAPAGREVRSSLVPDRFGGNMDAPQVRAGATVYLGVNVEGALFSIGDGHYRQGEGEACGTAVEGAMTTTLIVELVKGGAPAWPRIEDDTHWMTVGSSRPLEDAWRIAQSELVHWFGELYGLHRMDAYQLLSQITEAPIANVVDANYSSVVKARKALLPAAQAYGGLHADLRRRALTI